MVVTRFVALSLPVAAGPVAALAPDPAEWQNPQRTQQGQEASRATFGLAGPTGTAPWQQSLNGTWKISLSC